jgi:hypothetical protein
MKRGVDALEKIGKARAEILPQAEIENIIAAVAGAVERIFALQHLRVFSILMAAIRTDEKNARGRPRPLNIGGIPPIVAPRNGVSPKAPTTAL